MILFGNETKQKKNNQRKDENENKGKAKRKPFDYSSRRTTWLDEMKKRAFEDVDQFPNLDEDLDDQEMDMPADVADDDDTDEEDSILPMKSVVGCLDISEIANDSGTHVPFRDWTCSIVNRRRGKSLLVVFQKGYVGKAISRRGKIETRFPLKKIYWTWAFLPRPHTRGKYWTFSSGGEIRS